MQKVNEIFGFLSPKQLTTLDNKTLREKATTLANLYRDDLDMDELSVEIESFKNHNCTTSMILNCDIQENVNTAMNVRDKRADPTVSRRAGVTYTRPN
ncbi:hypothetical protein AVEN_6768-1 [Araneus ventricosus]|uniref:Uncharacterized protein n=1 Tax=Araneus ventricosus TaxID=182803 RepID=A0A4Y2GUD5_ARAVE|nr:hypothetical protein AVEN_6768-1 [Araneus ventricosus]